MYWKLITKMYWKITMSLIFRYKLGMQLGYIVFVSALL